MSESAPSTERVPTAGSPTAADQQHPVDPGADISPGRRVVLTPTRPGFWRVVMGAVIALLAPFFGILIGSGIGQSDGSGGMQPMYWGFFIGGLIGAAALLVAVSGALVLWREAQAENEEEQR